MGKSRDHDNCRHFSGKISESGKQKPLQFIPQPEDTIHGVAHPWKAENPGNLLDYPSSNNSLMSQSSKAQNNEVTIRLKVPHLVQR